MEIVQLTQWTYNTGIMWIKPNVELCLMLTYYKTLWKVDLHVPCYGCVITEMSRL